MLTVYYILVSARNFLSAIVTSFIIPSSLVIQDEEMMHSNDSIMSYVMMAPNLQKRCYSIKNFLDYGRRMPHLIQIC